MEELKEGLQEEVTAEFLEEVLRAILELREVGEVKEVKQVSRVDLEGISLKVARLLRALRPRNRSRPS